MTNPQLMYYLWVGDFLFQIQIGGFVLGITDKTMLESALEYIEMGFYIFPTREVDGNPYKNDKEEMVVAKAKSPYIAGGVHSSSNEEFQIKKWWTKYPDAGVGLDCGKSKIFVIDLDTHAKNQKSGLENFMDLGVPHRDCWECLTPSGGVHLFYSDPKGIGKSTSNSKTQIDTRGKGGYVILPHSWLMIPSTKMKKHLNDLGENVETIEITHEKRFYTKLGKWDGVPMEIMSSYLDKLGIGEKKKITSRDYSPVDVRNNKELARVIEALNSINGEYCDDRYSWIAIGMALKSLKNDAITFTLWDEWSSKSEKYSQPDAIKQWDSFNSNVTIGTLFYYANLSGWRDKNG